MDIKEVYNLIETGNVEDNLLEIKEKTDLGDIYYQLGNIYCRSYGDIDQSDYYYDKAFSIFKELNEKKKLIHTIRDMAVNFELKGEYDRAMVEFEKCLEMSKKENYELGLVLSYGGIGLLYQHMGDQSNPRVIEITEEVKHLAKKFDSQLLYDASLLGDSLVLENSLRLKDKIKAQDILENLVDNTKYPIIQWSATRFLIKNYLLEFITTKNYELLNTVRSLINSLKQTVNPTTFSPISNSLIAKIRMTILESRLFMVEGDLETSRIILTEMFDELQNLKKSTVLIRLEEEITSELNNLNNEYTNWEKLMNKNASFEEMVHEMKLKEYITKAQKLLTDELVH